MGWVCPECGVDYDTISPSDAVVALRSFPRRYRAALTTFEDDEGDPEAAIRRRPAPDTWSALEYTGHVTDLFDTIDESIRRMLVENRPELGFWDPDQRAAERRYGEQDAGAVLESLRAVATRMADRLERVVADDWTRTGVFPWGERDVLTMARNAVHEGAHHLRDVERGLQQVRGRPRDPEEAD